MFFFLFFQGGGGQRCVILCEMSFENVDGRRTDAGIYYKLTCEPSAQVS